MMRNQYRKRLGKKIVFFKDSKPKLLKLERSIHVSNSYRGDKEFVFLNLSKKFSKNIDWNESVHGKLWTYNLNYFDFLSQDNNNDFIFLIEDFINKIEDISDGMEPYPISLRGINWVKCLSTNNIKNQTINDSLYAQYYILHDSLEYHLLGNHLLENGFSLLFGAYYFQDDVLYETAKKILIEELEEQILEDGAHFELSPMYHQIILFRLLEVINVVLHNPWKEKELLSLLVDKAAWMLGWLTLVSYNDGTIPLLNDSTNNIAPTSTQLFEYADRLGIKRKEIILKESGYRKYATENYEAIIDIGDIGPDYIPGHAHSDTFSFEMKRKGKPFIVDTGVSTYQANKRRTLERSTCSHNTVEINGKEQSEVWGGFRVANRAKVIDIQERFNTVHATHDGYKSEGVFHTRQWFFESDYILIKDTLSKKAKAVARIHFHPDISQRDIEKSIEMVGGKGMIREYTYAPEFNREIKALLIEVEFSESLQIKIQF